MASSLSVRTLSLFIHFRRCEAIVPERDHCKRKGGVNSMPKKEILDKLSIYIPQKKMEDRPVERLIRLGEKRDRSINYLVVDAIIQYLEREENKS